MKRATGKIFSALAVLAFGIAPARADKAVNFRCDHGQEFTAIFEDSGTLLIMIDGGALRLEELRAASGIWFSSHYGEFRGKNGSSLLR
jgi:hypothetical protein